MLAASDPSGSINNVMHRRFLHLPIFGIRVVPAEGEAVPILVVQLGMVAAVVVAGPARFGAEAGVMGHGLRGPDAVVEFPRPLQLVQAVGAQVVDAQFRPPVILIRMQYNAAGVFGPR